MRRIYADREEMEVILNMPAGSFVVILVVDALLAYATGRMARDKGYSYRAFAALGFLLPVIGLAIAALMPRREDRPDELSNARAIAEYKRLLDDGTITQEEFDAKKRELL